MYSLTLKGLEITNFSTNHDLKPTIETWLHETFQLEELKLCTVGNPMPNYVMTRFLKNNTNTLTRLSIFNFNFDQYTLNTIYSTRLHQLKIVELTLCTIENPTLFSDFLKEQAKLESLSFERMAVQKACLESIPFNANLKEIRFLCCEFDPDTLTTIKRSDSLESVYIEGDDSSSQAIRVYVTANYQMIQPSLQYLQISFREQNPSTNNNWIRMIPMTFPNLVYVDLQNLRKITPEDISAIFKLQKLEFLGMSRCEVYDEAFVETLHKLPAFHSM